MSNHTIEISTGPALEIEEEPVAFVDRRGIGIALGAIPFIVGLIAWAILSKHRPESWRFAVPDIGDTLGELRTDLFESSTAWSAMGITLKETLIGFVIAAAFGVSAGVALGLSRRASAMFFPFIFLIESIPKIALAPLMLLIFGFGSRSNIALAVAIAFFPILVNTQQGMKQIRLDEIELFRSLEASRWQMFRKLRLPRAFPSIFSGLQLGLLFSLVGVVVGEMLNEGTGLGYLITSRDLQLQIPGMYSALIILALFGLVLSYVVRWSGRLVSNWRES